MRALDIEDNIEHLRYDKVVLATDAAAASAKLGGKSEITRIKGLGEISPNEFKQFIGKEMRVSQVEYAPKVDSQQDSLLLHGQEHVRAEGLHHGEPRGDGGE